MNALFNTSAGSLYALTKLINLLNKRPKETLTKRIDIMLGSSTTDVKIYSATLGAIDGTFDINIEPTKVHKSQLLTLDNPNYATLLRKYSHLRGLKTEDNNTRPQIPTQVVLGASEYATIKTSKAQRVGKPGQPVAEKTLLGWTLMSPEREDVGIPVLLTQSALVHYEELCSLDVLGLTDTHENDQLEVYEEFREQLEWIPTSWYETKLPWKANHPTLLTNKAGSERTLEQLIWKLEWNGQYKKYNSIIQEQLQGVITAAPEAAAGKEFYIPHEGVIRENAKSTQLWIVYDASAREIYNQPSLKTALTQSLLFRTVCGIFLWGPDSALYCSLVTLSLSSSPNKERRDRFPALPLEISKQKQDLSSTLHPSPFWNNLFTISSRRSYQPASWRMEKPTPWANKGNPQWPIRWWPHDWWRDRQNHHRKEGHHHWSV